MNENEEKRVCPKCGTPMGAHDRFCVNCGTPAPADDSAAADRTEFVGDRTQLVDVNAVADDEATQPTCGGGKASVDPTVMMGASAQPSQVHVQRHPLSPAANNVSAPKRKAPVAAKKKGKTLIWVVIGILVAG